MNLRLLFSTRSPRRSLKEYGIKENLFITGNTVIDSIILLKKINSKNIKTIFNGSIELKKIMNKTFLNKFNLTQKTALITGSAGLLGYEHAVALLEIGANLIITDIDVEIYKQLYKNSYGADINNTNTLKDLILIKKVMKDL